MPSFRDLGGLEVRDRVVLVRADLNVPTRDGAVTDATRIERVAPTLRELAEAGAKVVVLSHFGRPKGQPVPEMSLAPLAGPLGQAIGRPVAFANDCVGPDAEAAVSVMTAGDVLLLENLRFHAEEEANDPGFARALAALGDLYVNDAFSCAHRAHASTEAIAHLLPSAAGRLMQAELEALDAALGAPRRPVLAVVGGAKVSTKLDVLGHLIHRVDRLAIGGGMANTFLAARGVEVGASLREDAMRDTAREIMAKAETAGCAILLPEDVVVAAKLEVGVSTDTVDVTAVPKDRMILDVGPRTVRALIATLEDTCTVVWNGPLGAFEVPPFDAGTNQVARAVAERGAAGHLVSVAGGGDTVAALGGAGVVDRFGYVSTAGGAFLEWLEGKTLPGVAALQAD